MSFARTADFRYEFQEYQIACDMPAGKADKTKVRKTFDAAYLKQYGHANEEARLEVVTLRVMAIGKLKRPGIVAPKPVKAPPSRKRKVFFDGKSYDTAIVNRPGLGVGKSVMGPAIIEEPTATTVLPPGWKATIIQGGHMSLKRAK
jgi:N-methylhydantoinase A